jgi:hypothetical protein
MSNKDYSPKPNENLTMHGINIEGEKVSMTLKRHVWEKLEIAMQIIRPTQTIAGLDKPGTMEGPMAALSESGTGTVLEVAKVVLPYLPDTAKDRKRSAAGAGIKLPGFSWNSSMTAIKLQDTLGDAYLIILWQYQQQKIQYWQYRACTDYWSA